MEIYHIKKQQCQSTQDELLNLVDNKTPSLCSTKLQTKGRGRSDHSWSHNDQWLAFSFTLTPSEILTLSSLEIGVLISDFLNIHYSVDAKLKWPNDIHDTVGNKVGGILLHNSEKLVVGVGLNWAGTDPEYHSLFPSKRLVNEENHQLALDIYKYILENRLSSEKITSKWNKLCSHLNKRVKISDTNTSNIGIFSGIGPMGEALVSEDGQLKKYYTGSLEIIG